MKQLVEGTNNGGVINKKAVNKNDNGF